MNVDADDVDQHYLIERATYSSLQTLRLGRDYDLYKWFYQGLKLCKQLADDDQTQFSIRSNGMGDQLLYGGVGKALLQWIADAHAYWKLINETKEASYFELNPRFRAMIPLLTAVDGVDAGVLLHAKVPLRCVGHIQCLNAGVEHCRRVLKSELFKRELSNAKRHERDTRRSLLQYLQHLSDRHAKLLVVRIDLHYVHDASIDGPIGPRPPLDLVMAQRDAIIKRVRSYAQGSLLGYIIRSEFGFYKGPHHHAVFVFNGHLRRADITIGDAIGRMWNQDVANGRGSHFVCNKRKWRYLSCGIGQVDYRNERDWQGAVEMVNYLSKPPEFGVVWAAGRRTLVKGEVPAAPRVRLGRPRQGSMVLAR